LLTRIDGCACYHFTKTWEQVKVEVTTRVEGRSQLFARPMHCCGFSINDTTRNTIQTHARIARTRFLVIPKLDTFEQPVFAVELNDIVSTSGEDPFTDAQLLRRAVGVVSHKSVKENRVTNPQLNRAKEAISAGNPDTTVVLSQVHLPVSQECPCLPPGQHRRSEGQGQQTGYNTPRKVAAAHLNS